ncbi:MAG: type II secretion system major pseudopilin GspG [Candidatus Sumerlaeales bacterium]|nr:type II secretion system major pseudopilin GspG [Candidatus Sumerlaeales bacterium]
MLQTNYHRHLQRGFTLIELMLVVTILGILMAVVMPNITGKTKEVQIKACRTSISNLSTALGMFEVKSGRFPTTEEGLDALVTKPSDLDDDEWSGPYLKDGILPQDPWKQDYIYRCPGELGGDFDLISKGPDKQENTEDDITNIKKKAN